MKRRPCPFCGKKPEKYRSTWYVCKECEIEVPVEVWDYRYDDWRSDGWPAFYKTILLWETKLETKGYGHVRYDESISFYMFKGGDYFKTNKEDCKWKPMPESEGGGA